MSRTLTKFLIFTFFWLLSACTLKGSFDALEDMKTASELFLKIGGDSTLIEVNEGSSVVLVVLQNAPVDTDTHLSIVLSGDPAELADVFPSTTVNGKIAAGSTSTTIPIETLHNPLLTGSRQFSISITSEDIKSSNNLSVALNVRDLEAPLLSINNVTGNEGANLIFTVSLTPASTKTMTIGFVTENVSATAGTHYVAQSGNLVFSPGQTSKTVTIVSNANTSELCAVDRTFKVKLSESTLSLSTQGTGTIQDPDLPVLSIANASANEGQSLSFPVSLSGICSTKDVSFTWATSANTATSGSDYTPGTGTITIAAGNTSANLTVATSSDANYEANETLTVTLTSPTNATLGTAIATGTILDTSLGSFTISGVMGSNGTDVTADAYLNKDTKPKISWSASAGATSYNVTVYQNDGTTVQCATQNSVTTSYDFSLCSLTGGNTYKVNVVATDGTLNTTASNSLYSFLVNRDPTISATGAWFVLAGGTITINALYAASPAVGEAVDADSGQTLSFSAAANGTLGTVTNNASNIVYTSSSATNPGVDSIAVTIADGVGGSVTTNIPIYVVTAYSWTGAVNSTWSSAQGGNWCGAVNANKKGCTNAGSVPGASHIAVIDGTCTTANCSPTTNYNVSVAGLILGGNTTLTQGTGVTLTVGISGWKQNNANFAGSNSTITIGTTSNSSYGLNVTGTSNFKSTSGNLNSHHEWIISSPATFTHNAGTLTSVYTRARSFDPGTSTYNNVIIKTNYDSFYVGTGTMSIAGNLSIDSTSGNASSATGIIFDVKGDISVGNRGIDCSSGACATIKVSGSGTQTITGNGGTLPRLTLESTGTVNLSGTIRVQGDFRNTSGTINVGTSTLSIYCDGYFTLCTVYPKTLAFNNVTFVTNYLTKYAVSGALTVNGTLTIDGSSGLVGSLQSGSIDAYGDVNLGTKGLSCEWEVCGQIRFLGTNNRTITGGAAPGPVVPKLEINTPGATLSFANAFQVQKKFEYIDGIMNWGSSTLVFTANGYAGTLDIIPGSITYGNIHIQSNYNTFISLGSNTLKVGGNFTTAVYDWPSTLNSGTVQVEGNVTFGGKGLYGNAQLSFVGTGTQTLTMDSTSSVPSGLVSINKASGSVVLAANAKFNNTGQNLNIISGTLDMAGYDLTIKNQISNAGTLTRGTNPQCGTITATSFVGTAAVCP